MTAVLLSALLALSQEVSSRPSLPDVEDAAWRRLQALIETAPDGEGEQWFAGAAAQRRAIAQQAVAYLRLYPGGRNREEVVAAELQALYELGVLEGGEFGALERRLEVHSQSSDVNVAAEAAFWRLQLPGDATRERSATHLSEDRYEAYASFVRSHPRSRHTPRLLALLFDEARRREDRGAMRRWLGRAREVSPLQIVEALAGRLRRYEQLGERFPLELKAGGNRFDAEGRSALIVIWSRQDPQTAELCGAIERWRTAGGGAARVVLGLNADPDPATMRDAIERWGLEAWRHEHEPLGVGGWFPRQWGVQTTPFVFRIDDEGRLEAAGGGRRWGEVLGDTATTP